MNKLPYFLSFSLFLFLSCQPKQSTTDAYSKWQTITLDFNGPNSDEQSKTNPFTDYRMIVRFTNGEQSFDVPGYYAADGNSAETSAEKGNIWRVKFTPNMEGDWSYEASFRQGKNIAIRTEANAGKGLYFDGTSGHFKVGPADQDDPSSKKGRLKYVGERYLKFQETGEYFLKGGPNSPENFLAYEDFDGTYPADSSKNFMKKYEPHLQDWQTGDPVWKSDKGKGIIGALNYIASKGMNVVYFLTMNIEGDGRDVWPYIAPDIFDRFDCSKLDQWEIVFEHAQKLGIMLHFVTQETENEMLLDNGNTDHFRKLYYRELIARFGHHLMITWNLGEENGPASFTPIGQNDRQRKDMATYFKKTDPYQNYLVVHTHSWDTARDSIVDSLYNFKYIDGLSLQINHRKLVHEETKKYIDRSEKAGRIWVSSMDEIGLYWMGVMPDKDDVNHDTIRQEVLWGHLMAGGPGVEWYFGYMYAQADLNCEDWRSRDKLWDQTNTALQFFRALPFPDMKSHDELIDNKNYYCFAKPGEVYAIYFKQFGSTNLKVIEDGEYTMRWFDPKDFNNQFETKRFAKDGNIEIGWPMAYKGLDLAVVVRKSD